MSRRAYNVKPLSLSLCSPHIMGQESWQDQPIKEKATIQSKTESVKLGGSDAVISHLGLLGLTSTLVTPSSVTRCTKLLLTEHSVCSLQYILAYFLLLWMFWWRNVSAYLHIFSSQLAFFSSSVLLCFNSIKHQ